MRDKNTPIQAIPMAFNTGRDIQVLHIPELDSNFNGQQFIEIDKSKVLAYMHQIAHTSTTINQLNILKHLGYNIKTTIK